jgi:hypothetical protein
MSDQEIIEIPITLRLQHIDGRIEEMLLEEYLKGVLPAEMGMKKPLEALRAQAIAARSFASATRRHALQNFDVCTTAHCQAWKPEKRYAEADRAVDETTGQILTYNGNLIAAHFFGHCDGRTRNSEEVWQGEVAYLRSVPCICGHKKLWGHGVGMCQRGAVTMAEKGATAEAILKHYYTGVEISRAGPILRTGFRRSIILGYVVDGKGRPCTGQRLVLSGPDGSVAKGTTSQGRFWFTELPAGQWELRVKGQPVQHADLFTDGRNALQVNVVVPAGLPMMANAMPLAHPRQLVGTLGFKGVPVTVADPEGNEQTVLSGSAPEYNPGGFAVSVTSPGTYTIRVLGQSYDVQVGEVGTWVRFSAQAQ